MKDSPFRSLTRAALALALVTGPALSQTAFWSMEPNQTKATATEAFDMVAGDFLGTTFCAAANSNFFHVRTAPALPAIYEHRLTGTFFTNGFFPRIDIYGRDAYIGEVLPDSLARLSSSSDVDVPNPFVTWYGFGKSEELYVDFFSDSSCRGANRIFLSTSVVTPTVIAPLPLPGNGPSTITFRTTDPNGLVDSEIHLFDAEFNAIPGASNDRNLSSGSGDAMFHNAFRPGRYYVAVSETGIATHLPPTLETLELRLPAEVLDFAGGVVAGGPSTGLTFELDIILWGGNSRTVSVVKNEPFEIVWFSIDVGIGQDTSSFCPGDGTTIPCPCGATAPLGSAVGCVNSTGRGASIMSSFAGNELNQRLTIEDLPASAATALFLSLGTQTPAASMGGIACLGPGALRFPPIAADAAGTAVYMFYSASLPPALLGQSMFAQAAYRDAVAPPCNVNLTSGVNFTLL